MKILKKKNIDLKFGDKLYVTKIYEKIKMLIDYNEIDENTIIYKDATASGLQNYGIILGYKKEMLEYLNLNGQDWCDTYQYLINRFLCTEKKEWKKRKYWKKTIMTIPYNAKWASCFRKFLESLRKDGIEYTDFNEDEKKEIRELHRCFYNKIKKEIKNEFYKNNNKKLKMFKYRKLIISKQKEYKITYKKIRDKYVDIEYKFTDDKKSTKRALEANNMHFLDARLVKYILKKFDVLTVHDCFGIRLCELHLLMDKINKYYEKFVGIRTYSIHILI